MDIILLEKIANLGNLGDKVSVRPGYGRNYLIPKGKAVVATAEKLDAFEQRRAELEKKAAAELAAAQARAEALGQLAITITCKAGDEGRLYGSVGTKDIADAIIGYPQFGLGVGDRSTQARSASAFRPTAHDRRLSDQTANPQRHHGRCGHLRGGGIIQIVLSGTSLLLDSGSPTP